jgi:hypothetical protein
MLASASSVLQFHLCNTMPSTEVSCFSLSFFFFFVILRFVLRTSSLLDKPPLPFLP